jgi:membrane associated rhomboid family serine protease
MGIYDRDYYRDPAPNSAFGGLPGWSVNTWLLIINIAVFLIDGMSGHQIAEWGYFSITKAVYELQLWRLLTFQFLHASPQHIFGNMLALFFFGPLVESYLGSRRYLAFYLICGFAGPVMYVLLWAAHIMIYSANTPLIGASAGIMGVLIAGAHIAPDAQVLVYGIIPVRLRIFAWILLGIAIYMVLTHGFNAGGEAAHIGGAAAGFLLIKQPQLLNFVNLRRGPRMRYRP